MTCRAFSSIVGQFIARLSKGMIFVVACTYPLGAIAQDQPLTTTDKPHVIITTDGNIEANSSMIRYLAYANEFVTLGIVAGNSGRQKYGGGGKSFAFTAIDAYKAVLPNLQKHLSGWPAPEELKRVVKSGNLTKMGMDGVGDGEDTEGSNLIASALLSSDPHTIWILAWGGTRDSAQALYKIMIHYPNELARVLKKLKIFALAVPDCSNEEEAPMLVDAFDQPCSRESIDWLLATFPDIFIIRSNQYMTINRQHGPHPYSNDPVFQPAWTRDHVKTNHGPLGMLYPQDSFNEGDTITLLFFLNPKLRNQESPAYGSWGGRYQQTSTINKNLWTDASDDNDGWKPVWRWIREMQNDFAARMDYCVLDTAAANHRPFAVMANPEDRTVAPGEEVILDASSSYDPDGNAVWVKWWHYADQGTLQGRLYIERASERRATFIVPNQPGATIPLVLEVTDNGIPALKDYRLVIYTIKK